MKQQQFFKGQRAPSVDFEEVRDGTRSFPEYYDVDLSVAHSLAAGTQLLLPIAGNVLFIDQVITSGVAQIVFQEQLTQRPTAITVAPGFLARIAFTQVMILNAAQPGLILRIVYGTDLEFEPSPTANVTIAGTVPVQTTGVQTVAVRTNGTDSVRTEDYIPWFGAEYSDIGGMTAGTPKTVFAPASNLNGFILYDAEAKAASATGFGEATCIASPGAPNLYHDPFVLVAAMHFTLDGTLRISTGKLTRPVRVIAGEGLYFMVQITDTGSYIKRALYTLL